MNQKEAIDARAIVDHMLILDRCDYLMVTNIIINARRKKYYEDPQTDSDHTEYYLYIILQDHNIIMNGLMK